MPSMRSLVLLLGAAAAVLVVAAAQGSSSSSTVPPADTGGTTTSTTPAPPTGGDGTTTSTSLPPPTDTTTSTSAPPGDTTTPGDSGGGATTTAGVTTPAGPDTSTTATTTSTTEATSTTPSATTTIPGTTSPDTTTSTTITTTSTTPSDETPAPSCNGLAEFPCQRTEGCVFDGNCFLRCDRRGRSDCEAESRCLWQPFVSSCTLLRTANPIDACPGQTLSVCESISNCVFGTECQVDPSFDPDASTTSTVSTPSTDGSTSSTASPLVRCEDFNGDRASCLTVEAATCIYDDASMTCIDLFGLTTGTPDTDYCGILTVEQCREVFTLCTYSIPPGQLSGTCRALECTDANEPGSCSTATCTIYGSIANNDFLCLPSDTQPTCSQLRSEALCTDSRFSSVCSWDAVASYCTDGAPPPCSAYKTAASCPSPNCEFDTFSQTCNTPGTPIPCYAYETEAGCVQNSDCAFNPVRMECVDSGARFDCSELSGLTTQCTITDYCTVDPSTFECVPCPGGNSCGVVEADCASLSDCSSSPRQCEAAPDGISCQSSPCSSRDRANCLGACTWNVRIQQCLDFDTSLPCNATNYLGADGVVQCAVQAGCTFFESVDGCHPDGYEVPCSDIKAEDLCNDGSGRCAFDPEAEYCNPNGQDTPCSALTSKPLVCEARPACGLYLGQCLNAEDVPDSTVSSTAPLSNLTTASTTLPATTTTTPVPTTTSTPESTSSTAADPCFGDPCELSCFPAPGTPTGYTCAPCPDGTIGDGSAGSCTRPCPFPVPGEYIASLCSPDNTYVEDDSCDITCVTGTRPLVSSPTATCQADGTWSTRQVCEDIPECLEANDCFVRTSCRETTLGQYNCSCPAGFAGSGKGPNSCIEIRACDSAPCKNGRECIPGDPVSTFSCGPCPAGSVADSDTTCRDIDECSETCGATAASCVARANPYCFSSLVCNNYAGSANCSACPRGFEGDGIGPTGCTPKRCPLVLPGLEDQTGKINYDCSSTATHGSAPCEVTCAAGYARSSSSSSASARYLCDDGAWTALDTAAPCEGVSCAAVPAGLPEGAVPPAGGCSGRYPDGTCEVGCKAPYVQAVAAAPLTCSADAEWVGGSGVTCSACDGVSGYQDQDFQTSCKPISTCTAQQYQAAPPTATSNRQCVVIRMCGISQYQTAPPTLTSNRECTSLTVCQSGQYQMLAPTPTSNRQCGTCSACPSGETRISGVCTGSSPLPAGVDPARPCIACRTCDPATQYRLAACTPLADTSCANIALCAIGFAETVAPTPTSNRVCAAIDNKQTVPPSGRIWLTGNIVVRNVPDGISDAQVANAVSNGLRSLFPTGSVLLAITGVGSASRRRERAVQVNYRCDLESGSVPVPDAQNILTDTSSVTTAVKAAASALGVGLGSSTFTPAAAGVATNPADATTQPPPSNSGSSDSGGSDSSLIIIVAAAAGGVLIVVLLVAFVCMRRKRTRATISTGSTAEILQLKPLSKPDSSAIDYSAHGLGSAVEMANVPTTRPGSKQASFYCSLAPESEA